MFKSKQTAPRPKPQAAARIAAPATAQPANLLHLPMNPIQIPDSSERRCGSTFSAAVAALPGFNFDRSSLSM